MTNIELILGTAQATAHTALGEVAVNIENSIIQMPLDSDMPFTTDRVFLHTPSAQGLQDFSSVKNSAVRHIIEQIDSDIPGSIHLVEMDSPVAFTVWINMGVAIANGLFDDSYGVTLTRNGVDARCEPLCIETSWTSDKTWDEYGIDMTAADFVAAARKMVGFISGLTDSEKDQGVF